MSKLLYRFTGSVPKLVRASDPASDPKRSIGTIEGYAAVFNSDSEDLGGYIERIRPGAFKASVASFDVRALKNHNHDLVLGRISAATLRLKEDDVGLAYAIDLPDVSYARDLVVSAERGDLTGCSFGFDWPDPTEMEWSQRDGKDLCELLVVHLHEISVGVTFPAYEATTMGLRARFGPARKGHSRARYRSRLAVERSLG